MSHDLDRWTIECRREIRAAKEAVWRTLADTAGWSTWNPGVAAIELEGAFASGSSFTMVLPDGGRVRSKIIAADPQIGFTDESSLGELTITVAHVMKAIDPTSTEVTYRLTARGPEAREVGKAVSNDFDEVLAGLARVLEGRED